MPAMLMTLKVRLKVRKTAGEKLRRAMGCARFVHNALLYERDFDYRDYPDEIESRLFIITKLIGKNLLRRSLCAHCNNMPFCNVTFPFPLNL